jgi:hypothetical protein
MKKTPPGLEGRPDVTGVGLLRTAHGFDGRCKCAFFLPSTEMAKIWVLVRTPSGSNGPVVLDWKFSCELTAGTDRFAAEEIFHWGYIEWDWGDSPEDTLVGDTTKLTVARGEAEESPIIHAQFVITPSVLLRSADILTERQGKVVSEKVARAGPLCSAGPGITFQFASAYRRNPAGKIESNVECELREPKAMADPTRVLGLLEDVLTLASLAERRVLLLTGWHVHYQNGAIESTYRRDFTMPSAEESDVDHTLISLQNIEEFLNRSVEKLAGFSHPGALKQSIQFALHGQGRRIGDSFVMLFAGVETLLNLFVSGEDIEPIVPKRQWEEWCDLMTEAVQADQDFRALPDAVQAQLVGNVRGANRAFFADRFLRMCSSQEIELMDLWPMLGGRGSLYAVRNRIVHGRVFSTDQEWFRVVSAKYHLLWTLERSILRILGWPVAQSRVSPRALRGLSLYGDWHRDRDYFAAAK